MKRVNDTNINTVDHWNEVYLREYRSAKKRFDDDRRDFLYGAISDWWQYEPYTNGPRLLDVGCGEGQTLRSVHILFPSWQKFGVDISNAVIDQNRIEDPGFHYECASAYQLPYPEGHFAVIHCGETLEHLDDPTAAVNEMYRLLIPGGNLVLSVPLMHMNPSDEHVWEFTIEEAIALTARFGELRNLKIVAGGLSIMWSTKIPVS